jgi:cytochrome c biogenesis protein CcmG/thiol:disulfide interchange protein DsbE
MDTASRPTSRPRTWRSILATGITLLVAAALCALLLARIARATRQVAASSPPARSQNQGQSQPAADFTIPLWNGAHGQSMHLAALRGEVVVVNFWGSWCEPCQQEAPALAAAYKALGPQGVAFLGVAFQTPQADGVKFLREHEVAYPCGPAPDGLEVAYGLTGLPVTVVVDRHGMIARKFEGAVQLDKLEQAAQAALRL